MSTRSLMVCILITLAAVVNLKCKSSSNIYKSFPAATIVTPGDLYSTYAMSEDEKAKVRTAAINAKMDPEYVFSHAVESGWPSPLNDFSYRIDNANDIAALKVRIFADIGDEKYLLIAPASENKSGKIKVKEDIFLFYKKSAIQKK